MALGDCSPRAPTDPYVRTLAHTVHPMIGFAMQQRCIPGMLSWAVPLIRSSKFNASDVFPDPGSNIRHPLSVFPSLHRVLRDQFPGFYSTMKVLRLPADHPAALRFLRLAVPRLHSLFSLLVGRVHRRGLELVTRYLQPGWSEETTGSLKFLGNPNCPSAHVPRRRQDCLHQTNTVQQRGPWSSKGKGSHERSLDAQ